LGYQSRNLHRVYKQPRTTGIIPPDKKGLSVPHMSSSVRLRKWARRETSTTREIFYKENRVSHIYRWYIIWNLKKNLSSVMVSEGSSQSPQGISIGITSSQFKHANSPSTNQVHSIIVLPSKTQPLSYLFYRDFAQKFSVPCFVHTILHIPPTLLVLGLWCSSVITVSDCRLDDRGSIPGRDKGFFPIASVFRPAMRLTQSSPMGTWGSFLGSTARPGSDADHSLNPVRRSRMIRSYIFSSPSRLHGGSGTNFLWE
jgi:hypothetical protein